MTDVVLHPSNIVSGLWCHVCNTSEAWSADITTVTSEGVERIGTLTGCVRCDEDDT